MPTIASISPLNTLEDYLCWWESRQNDDRLPDSAPDVPSKILGALLCLASEDSQCVAVLDDLYRSGCTHAEKRIACSIALVAFLIDFGTMGNVVNWLVRYREAMSVSAPGVLHEFWFALGDIAARVLGESEVNDARRDSAATHIFSLLDQPNAILSPESKIVAGEILLEHAYDTTDGVLVDLITSLIEHDSLLPKSSWVAQARWYECLGYLRHNRGESELAKSCWTRAEEIAIARKLSAAGFMARIGLVRTLLDEGYVEEARESLARLRPAEGKGRANQVLLYKHVLARYLLFANQPSNALLNIDEALSGARRIGLGDSDLVIYVQEKAQVLFALGRHHDAEQLLLQYTDSSTFDNPNNLHVTRHLFRAAKLAAASEADSIDALSEALELAHTLRFTWFLRSLPQLAAQLSAIALANGVAPDFVTATIRTRKLRAPADAGPSWPWPVKIYLFGSLAVELDGKPLTFSGRVHAKPLELLAYLATRTEMRANSSSLADALWPNDDSVRSLKSLETTVARLRKLLGDDGLIRLAAGELSLDASRVWSEWQYFKVLSQQLVAGNTKGAFNEMRSANEQATRLLAVYKDKILATHPDVPWIISMQRECSERFVASAVAAHTLLKSTGSAAPSMFLEEALRHEPLSETLALALMEHYLESKRPADGLRVYRYFRDQLSIRAGVAPTPAIESLKARLLTA